MTEAARPGSARDVVFMRRALALARKGWGQTAPNPMVGAVVVSRGRVVGEEYHAGYGEEHAETAALRAAGARARGSTVYVTLEPCAHHGKTPPCVDALLKAGVARVVAAVRDPHPHARGGGEKLRAAGVEFVSGVCEPEARELNAAFFHAQVSDVPWVTLKMAVSLEGAITDASRSRGWFTGEASRREVHRLRAGADAIAIGVNTAVADDPLLTVRGVRQPRKPPLRVVLDRTARLPLEARLVRTAREIPTLVIAERPDTTRSAGLESHGVRVLEVPSLRAGLQTLRSEGFRSLLVEGGAKVAGALFAAHLVQRLVIFQAPVLLGAGALNAFACVPGFGVRDAPRFRVLRRKALGDDIMTVYAIDTR